MADRDSMNTGGNSENLKPHEVIAINKIMELAGIDFSQASAQYRKNQVLETLRAEVNSYLDNGIFCNLSDPELEILSSKICELAEQSILKKCLEQSTIDYPLVGIADAFFIYAPHMLADPDERAGLDMGEIELEFNPALVISQLIKNNSESLKDRIKQSSESFIDSIELIIKIYADNNLFTDVADNSTYALNNLLNSHPSVNYQNISDWYYTAVEDLLNEDATNADLYNQVYSNLQARVNEDQEDSSINETSMNQVKFSDKYNLYLEQGKLNDEQVEKELATLAVNYYGGNNVAAAIQKLELSTEDQRYRVNEAWLRDAPSLITNFLENVENYKKYALTVILKHKEFLEDLFQR